MLPPCRRRQLDLGVVATPYNDGGPLPRSESLFVEEAVPGGDELPGAPDLADLANVRRVEVHQGPEDYRDLLRLGVTIEGAWGGQGALPHPAAVTRQTRSSLSAPLAQCCSPPQTSTGQAPTEASLRRLEPAPSDPVVQSGGPSRPRASRRRTAGPAFQLAGATSQPPSESSQRSLPRAAGLDTCRWVDPLSAR